MNGRLRQSNDSLCKRRSVPSAVSLALVCSALLPSLPAMASNGTFFKGIVTRVSDGDTLWLRPVSMPGEKPRRPVKLRLVGLDAPESCQRHGAEATTALRERVLGRAVTVQRSAVDVYGRALVTLTQEGDDVGAWLVREGHAWSVRWRGASGPYDTEEDAARAARRGLFAEVEPEPPRDFRVRHGPCR